MFQVAIVLRKDIINVSGKTHKVNEQLKLLCDQRALTFIDNSIILFSENAKPIENKRNGCLTLIF